MIDYTTHQEALKTHLESKYSHGETDLARKYARHLGAVETMHYMALARVEHVYENLRECLKTNNTDEIKREIEHSLDTLSLIRLRNE